MKKDISTIEYLSVKEVSELTGYSIRKLQRRCNSNKYVTRQVDGVRGGNKGKSYEILISSLEIELQEKIYQRLKTERDLVKPCADMDITSDNISTTGGNTVDNNVDSESSHSTSIQSDYAPVSLVEIHHR